MSGERSPAGSVKRARERAAADLARENPMAAPFPTASPRRAPARPTVGSAEHRTQPPGVIRAGAPPVSGIAPQRPPRPNYVPLIPQGNSFADQPTTINPRRARNYWEDGYSQSGENSLSSSSRPSTTATGSSTASIPDFPTIPSMPSVPSVPASPISVPPPVPPIPQMPVPTYQPPRRNLGPPPSARRGVSSYYSQASFVPPIPEENSDAHSSYASSHAIPTSWADGPPAYYTNSGIEEEDEDVSTSGGDSGRVSQAGDHTEESTLMKKGPTERSPQPYMETLESGDESDRSVTGGRAREVEWQANQDGKWQTGTRTTTDAIGRHSFREHGRLQSHPYSGYESDATFLDSPRSVSPPRGMQTQQTHSPKANPYFGAPSPTSSPPPLDPRVGAILGHLEKGGALASTGTNTPQHSRSTSIHEKGQKRPPHLNLETPSQDVPRGSASSLPDLIRRATRLASNLDRGKTASRMGVLDMLNANERERRNRTEKTSRSGSISGILAAFPAPSPTTSTYQKPSTWSSSSTIRGRSNLSRSHTINHSSRGDRLRPRRCCGMPLWAFILLLIILLLLIAAAVIIPVTLVVLPRNSNANHPTVESCQKSTACQNGGSSIVVDNQCRCICVGGWTGSVCNAAPVTDGTCQSVDLTSAQMTYHQATLGSGIPRLLSAASPNYSIPLSGVDIASAFNLNNYSCSSQTSLVSFNQKSVRRDLPTNPQSPIAVELSNLLGDGADGDGDDSVTPTPSRTTGTGGPTAVLEARGAAQTSNDIIFAPTNGAGGGSSSNSTGSGTSTGTGSAASNSATSPSSATTTDTPITPSVLDFARTSVLFILQEKDLDTARNALEWLQMILSNGNGSTFDPSQTTVTGNVTVDLKAFTVGFGNGTFFGGNGNRAAV